jgi:hypothetical protein
VSKSRATISVPVMGGSFARFLAWHTLHRNRHAMLWRHRVRRTAGLALFRDTMPS